MDADKRHGAPDFVAAAERFRNLSSGHQAELRRAASPDDLTMLPALYYLFPGDRVRDGWLRIAFLLPYCGHRDGAPSLGRRFAEKNLSEARLFQMARAASPTDVIQLRRLAMQIDAEVDWKAFGWTLLKWDADAKRELVEDFFIARSKMPKGGKA